MRGFAELLERLALAPARQAKLALLEGYFGKVGRAEAGWALAVLTGGLEIRTLKAAALRELVLTRVDRVLYELSYDYVGDQAETIALLWPGGEAGGGVVPELPEIVTRLRGASAAEARALAAGWLDAFTPVERWALIKLATGAALRVGVSARLAKMALARVKGREVDELEAVWSAYEPPYEGLLAWLDGEGPAPEVGEGAHFHPLLLAHPLEEGELEKMPPGDYAAEWKWDGIRVQLAGDGRGRCRLFSRSGEEISAAFPEVVERAGWRGVWDGELLVRGEGRLEGELPGMFGDVAPFARLQQRLNRKRVTARLREEFPVLVVFYDVLFLEGRDLRGLSWAERRVALEAWGTGQGWDPAHFRISPLVPFEGWGELRRLREAARAHELEGLMLKRRDSVYVAGRPKGVWFKWKRSTLNIDAVLMYAQRGHGKRSSYYSDYTFGVWREAATGGRELVPVGKAYSGFTDEELGRLDRWVREHTVERFGSVRAVAPGLVLEVEFDGLQRSTRHKSGVAMRFPRIARIRWEKLAAEAATLEEVRAMLPAEGGGLIRL